MKKYEKIYEKENSFLGKGKAKREKESARCSENVAFSEGVTTKTS
jgi:hypothetical protein